jgi:hypothetical protein
VTITNRVSLKSVMAGVTPIADVPDAPTIGAATNVGTSRAYNNCSATGAYTAAPTGGTATTFTATSTPGSFTGTGTSPITVTGLQSATSYTFTVSAANANGTLTSAASSSITATTVPNAPTIGTFTDGGTGTTGTLSFTAPATGGSAITNYKYSTDSSTYTALSPAQTTSPLSLTGLTAGTYNFSVKAVNTNGDSAASSTVSGTVITPSNFESIASIDPTGQTSVTFSSISSSYKSLQIRVLARNANAQSGDTILLQFNSDTNGNYAQHYLYNYGSSNIGSGSDGTSSINIGYAAYGGLPSNQFGALIVNVVDYSKTTKFKTVRSYGGRSSSSADQSLTGLHSGHWKSTSAVNSVTVSFNANTFASGSYISLYGVS